MDLASMYFKYFCSTFHYIIKNLNLEIGIKVLISNLKRIYKARPLLTNV